MSDYSWSEGGKGALGGAAYGAAIGSIVPGIGTGIGAGVGGALGLLAGFQSGDTDKETQQRKMLQDYYNQVQNRPMQQMGPAEQGQYSSFRQNQSALVSRLEAMANGTGPSLARQQFEQATDRNMRGQQAMAASGRGGPLAQMTAANNMAMLGANAAQGSALARTNEQMQAIGQLGGVIGQGRAADENMNQFNAGQKNQMAMANMDARLRQMGLSDQTRLGILGQMFGLTEAQLSRPTLGDKLMAGGASAFSMGAMQSAQMKASGAGGGGGDAFNINAATPGTITPTMTGGGYNGYNNSYILGPGNY